jgi:hypothetical protein
MTTLAKLGTSFVTTEKDLARNPELAEAPLFAKALPVVWHPVGGDVAAFKSIIEEFWK